MLKLGDKCLRHQSLLKYAHSRFSHGVLLELNCRLSIVNKGGQGLVVGAGLDGARPHTYLQSMRNETTICSTPQRDRSRSRADL